MTTTAPRTTLTATQAAAYAAIASVPGANAMGGPSSGHLKLIGMLPREDRIAVLGEFAVVVTSRMSLSMRAAIETATPTP